MKRVLSVTLAVVMLVSLTACGSDVAPTIQNKKGSASSALTGVAEAFGDVMEKASQPSGDSEKYEGVDNKEKKDEAETGSTEGMPAESGEEISTLEEPIISDEILSTSELIELISRGSDLSEILDNASEEDIQAVVQDILTNPEKYAEMGVSDESIEALNGLLEQLQDVAGDMVPKKQPRTAE